LGFEGGGIGAHVQNKRYNANTTLRKEFAMNEKIKKVQEELAHMRTRMDELRVQGNLGKMEAREKLAEVKEAIDPAYQYAKNTIQDLASSGVDESIKLAKSMEAAWTELRQTYKQLSEEAKEEKAAANEARRHRGS
jgi:hypothetical protein